MQKKKKNQEWHSFGKQKSVDQIGAAELISSYSLFDIILRMAQFYKVICSSLRGKLYLNQIKM